MALINVYKIIRCYVFTLFITIPNFVGAADSLKKKTKRWKGVFILEARLPTVSWHEKKYVQAGVHKLSKKKI